MQQCAERIAHDETIVDSQIDGPSRIDCTGGDITQAWLAAQFDHPSASAGELEMASFVPAETWAVMGGSGGAPVRFVVMSRSRA